MRILTWDAEWDPKTLALRVIGLYDGKHTRHFLTAESFLRFILRPCYKGAYFFAHFGGRFDLTFLLRELQSSGLKIFLVFNGSSAVMVEIHDGENCWRLCDSQFLFKQSVYEMGKSVNLPKLECPFDAPLKQLKEYNERDCIIPFMALDRAAHTLAGLGSGLAFTLASTALQLFRRRYLSEDIPTCGALNREIRPGYVASRVEVISSYSTNGSHWDINSSFPYSQLRPLPGRLLRTNRTLGECCIADVDVYVPPGHLPPLPVRLDESIYFPYGSFRGWYAVDDLDLLTEFGGRINRVHRVHHFEPFDDLAKYVKDIYRLRLESHGDEFLRYFFKILLNSLYGKFGERPDKERVVFRPAEIKCSHGGKHELEPGRPTCMTQISPGIWRVKEDEERPHAHVPIPMVTTARSRASLLRGGARVKNLAYWDTDCVYGDCRGVFEASSKELGGWKHEFDYELFRGLRPKLYAVLRSDWTYDEEHPKDTSPWLIKAKGFPRLTLDDFDALEQGGGVDVRMFAGPRSLINDTRTAGTPMMPREEYTDKALFRVCRECDSPAELGLCPDHPHARLIAAHERRPKRRYFDTSSEPWDYQELLEPWKPERIVI